ncbi:MAG: hypothetical protein G8345_08075 [Magnetococcales bacterium]|nr:hypothetical protein [Magnetococcales bacterium]
MRNSLEKLLNAVTFAEAGEFSTASSMITDERSILLVLQEDEPPPWLLNTALSMVDRLEAGVEILLPAVGAKLSPTMARFVGHVEERGHHSRVIHRPDMVWENVAAYAQGMPSIVCIMVESLEKWGLKGDRATNQWRAKLPCPLVVAASI